MKTLDELLTDERRARLIPIVADSRKEERLVSILLASLAEVRPLAKTLLERCETKVGKYSRLTTYTEVEFSSPDGDSRDRPDGVLRLKSSKSLWTALVEAKVERAEIDALQVERYADIAQKNRIDAIITFSNQFVPLPEHVPYTIANKYKKNVTLFHFSWASVLTEAQLILRNTETITEGQAFVLKEMVRYFDHSSSGIRRFTQMNAEWKEVVFGIQNRQEFKWSSPEIERTVASWHQEERDMSLDLSRRLGQEVRIAGIPYKHRIDAALRLRDASQVLAKTKELRSSFRVPNAASDLEVVTNLQDRTILCSMKLDAPDDKKRATARINWLLKQLKSVSDGNIQVRAFWPGKSRRTQKSLADIRENIKCLVDDNAERGPSRFEVIMIRRVGGKFPRPRAFIEELELIVPEFYDQVGQHLRPWVKPPPAMDNEQSSKQADIAEMTSTDSGDGFAAAETKTSGTAFVAEKVVDS